MKKSKIGKGYYQSAYGRGFAKNPTIWLINGKAYAKNSNREPFETDLQGWIMVNKMGDTFCEVGLISDHKEYNRCI